MLRILRDLVLAVTMYLLIVFLWTSLAQAGTIVGKVTARGVRSPKDVVVYMDPNCNGNELQPAGKHTVVMDQVNMVFVPRILPVGVGTTVDFLNSDDVVHTVFTPSRLADKFDTGVMAKGEVRSYTFTKPGNVPLLCAFHPEMEAYVVVLGTSHYAVTDQKGNFEMPDVPPGTHRLVTWHKKLKPKTTTVVVPAQGTVEAILKLRR
ncbi:MAG: carboxypeptidase regulatory-like domain-containing protein [Dehalococcoidia bacterium]